MRDWLNDDSKKLIEASIEKYCARYVLIKIKNEMPSFPCIVASCQVAQVEGRPLDKNDLLDRMEEEREYVCINIKLFWTLYHD